jgi:hypothetical protein
MQIIERSRLSDSDLLSLSDGSQSQTETLSAIREIYQEASAPLQELLNMLQGMVLLPPVDEEMRKLQLDRAYRAALKATIMLKDVEENLERIS